MATVGDSAYYAGSIVEQIATASAIVHLPEQNVLKPLVMNIGKDKADTITVPVWNQGTNTVTSSSMGTHAEGTGAGAVKLNSDKKTGTMDMYSFYLPTEDEARDSSLEDIAARLGQEGSAVVGAKIDNLIATLFTSFTGNEAGTSTVTITVDMWFQALNLLKVDGAPMPYVCALYPSQIWGTYGISNDLVTSTQFGGSPTSQEEMLKSGWVGTGNAWAGHLAGVDAFSCLEVPTTGNASEGLMFSRGKAMCFGYVNPIVRVALEREGKLLRDDLVFSMFSSAWELVDNYGCTIHTKTS